MKNIVNAICGFPGFYLGMRLTEEDQVLVRRAIIEHMVERVKDVAPEMADLLLVTPLELYHTIAHRLPHEELLTRKARILQKKAVSCIRSTTLFAQLESSLGKFEITDEENIGRESISMRLVRPGVSTDVGSLHADDWFWKLYNFKIPKGKTRIKIWIAICCEPGKSGLVLCPNSHKRNWKYSVIERAGMAKPQLSGDESPELEVFQSNPGDVAIFNYHLLHGGMVTKGDLTRASIELTILVDDHVLQEVAPSHS